MEYRTYYLAREWQLLGHKVTIVAGSFSHLRHTMPVVHTTYTTEIIDDIKYIWCQIPSYKGNGIKRVLNIYCFIQALYKLGPQLIASKPQLVISSSTHPFDSKIAQQIACKARARFVHEVHDLWPLTLIELGKMSKWHPFVMLMQFYENFAYRSADKIISLLPFAATYMQQHGMQPAKFVHIPNGVSFREVILRTADNHNIYADIIAKHRANGKFIVGYAGGLAQANALGDLLSAAALIVDEPIAIIIVGDGICRTALLTQAIGLYNVEFLPAIAKTAVMAFLQDCDALYLGWQDIALYRYGVSANKMFDYMLAKKPILHAISAVDILTTLAMCAINVPAANAPAIAAGLVKISKLPAIVLAQMGQNGYDYVMANHDYATIAQQFLAAVDY